jgi:hypothetical protein
VPLYPIIFELQLDPFKSEILWLDDNSWVIHEVLCTYSFTIILPLSIGIAGFMIILHSLKNPIKFNFRIKTKDSYKRLQKECTNMRMTRFRLPGVGLQLCLLAYTYYTKTKTKFFIKASTNMKPSHVIRLQTGGVT